MNHAYIVDAIRTPFGRYGGALSSVRADDLGAIPIRALMARTKLYRQVQAWFERFDVIVMPTLTRTALGIDEALFAELRNEMHKHEPGCLLYSLLKSRKSSSDYIVHEQYLDQAALDGEREPCRVLFRSAPIDVQGRAVDLLDIDAAILQHFEGVGVLHQMAHGDQERL